MTYRLEVPSDRSWMCARWPNTQSRRENWGVMLGELKSRAVFRPGDKMQ